jgi:hypothetical protein
MADTMARKSYTRPTCRQLGSVQEMTQASNLNNCDTPCGANNNTAFGPPS